MPKPLGTYLSIQRQQRIRLAAAESKRVVNLAKKRDLTEFHQAVDALSEDELDAWHRTMSAYASEISKDGALAKEDKVRKAVKEVLGEVRGILEKAQDYQQLEAKLRVPIKPIIQKPLDLGPGGVDLALVVALIRVLEWLVMIRKRK